tara:strand:+ start:1695 stop:2297 length:603 start_codon:yes stop_codon:yes gene_type:complete
MAMPYQIPGATAVGITFENGVVLGAEKRVSYGTHLVSRSGKKVFKITDTVGAVAAGMISDMNILMREVTAHAKILQLETNQPVLPNSIAKLMGVIMYQQKWFPMMTQIILAGIEDKKPAVYVLDPLGSVIPDEYATVGTGAELAIGVVESDYKKNMSEQEAVDLAIKSIRSAINRDAASGDGIDILVVTENEIREQSVNT